MSSHAVISVSQKAVQGETFEVDVTWPNDDNLWVTPTISVTIVQDGTQVVNKSYNSKNGSETFTLSAPRTNSSVVLVTVNQDSSWPSDSRVLFPKDGAGNRFVVTCVKTGNDTTNDGVDTTGGDTKSLSDYADEYLGSDWKLVAGGGTVLLICGAVLLRSAKQPKAKAAKK